jgi:ATP/maltotriose-dependent transcriptional regulator MalT
MAESIRLSELAGFISPLIIVRADLARLYGGLGAFERGQETARLALSVAKTKMPVFRVYALAALTQLYLQQGHLAEAEGLVGQMKDDPNRDGWGLFPALSLLAEAELARRQGQSEGARGWIEEAVVVLQQLGLRALLPDALYLQGWIWLDLGQAGVARQCWLEAHREAEAMGSRQILWQILAALSQLETDPAEAYRLRQQARKVIDYIAGRTASELRRSFLALPTVQAVLSG